VSDAENRTPAHEEGPLPVVIRMPDDLANQIAAGEVVERPASVVKELVENAIDAGASRIQIELEEAGQRLIRVSDDGTGMARGDAVRCVERHATSKLTSAAQLFNITTLGFRGEALPSIASVSRFELLTKPRGVIGGTRVRIEGGAAPIVSEAGCPPGTTITVRDLFFNTPARAKFLKTRATEFKHAIDVVHRVALPNPQVGFVVQHNGKKALDLPPVTRAEERIFAFVGAEDARHMFPLEPASQDAAHAKGFFGQPAYTKRTAEGIWTFVNGRFVRDKALHAAVKAAYQGLVDRGRYPVAFLFVEVPPELVDVNVHPMKTEVRFHDANAVFRAVRRSVLQSLARSPWIQEDAATGSGASIGARASAAARSGEEVDEAIDHQPSIPVRVYTLHSTNFPEPSVVPEFLPRTSAGGRADAPRPGGSYGGGGGLAVGARADQRDDARPSARALATGAAAARGGDHVGAASRSGRMSEEPAPRPGYFASLHVIGTFRGTYILATDGGDAASLVVIDQHAAHERITFERLRKAWSARRVESQMMLVPKVITLDASRAAAMEEHLNTFEGLGFEIEAFGGNAFAVKHVPRLLDRGDYQRVIEDALDDLIETGNAQSVDTAIDAVLIRMACHGSVRAGDRMSEREIFALFEQLDEIDFGGNCPHGRPVYFRMGIDEIERRFDRR